jgi:hypothetical protein
MVVSSDTRKTALLATQNAGQGDETAAGGPANGVAGVEGWPMSVRRRVGESHGQGLLMMIVILMGAPPAGGVCLERG